MAIAKYIVNNKKKTALVFGILLTVSIILLTLIYAMRTKAGVFITDDKGERFQTDDIYVLEIVAEEGQQVLGYTVEGEEPISIENINEYKGTADIDVNDFKNATGYIVDKTANDDGTFSYTVKQSVLNKTFNANVLGDSMASGGIHVNAVQARDVTLEDINNANLIFINSNDYNENIMYYYDTFVHNGELGYSRGYRGHNYTYKEVKTELKSDIAIKKICSAAGNKTLAYNLSKDDFLNAVDENGVGLQGYEEKYHSLYQSIIANSEKESFNAETTGESLNLINGKISEAFEQEQQKAFDYIKTNVIGKTEEIADDVKQMTMYYLSIGGWENYFEDNIDYYINEFKAAIPDNIIFIFNIQDLITNGNGNALMEVMPLLYGIKQDAISQAEAFDKNSGEVFEYNISDENRENFVKYLSMIGISNLNNEYMNDYIISFGSEDFNMTNPEDGASINNAYSEIKGMITDVNTRNRDNALQLIADSLTSEDLYARLEEDAEYIFRSSELLYTEENINKYLEDIRNITDVNYFKNLENGKYVIEKIQSFISKIDDENKVTSDKEEEVIVSYDLTWQAAKGIYDYTMKNSKALMYNTELLTNSELGDYTDTAKEDNTNNLYKLLMITRQLKSSYFIDNYENKIDDYGVYYEGGLDANTGIGEGLGIASWNKETFGTDYENVTDKYHEPDVVGQTYTDSGVPDADTNYVYKHIYSFTGPQFMGGEIFVSTDMEGQTGVSGVITPNAGYTYNEHIENDFGGGNATTDTHKYIYLCTGDYNWNTPYAWVWKAGGDGSDFKMERVENNIFRLELPANTDCNRILFKAGQGWGMTQTVDITLPDNWDGTQYYLYKSGLDGSKLNCYVLAKHDNYYNLSKDRIYLDASKFGWTKAYAHFHKGDENFNYEVEMHKDNSNGLWYVTVPSNYGYVFFSNQNGEKSHNITLPGSVKANGHVYYLEYKCNDNIGKISVSTSRFSSNYYSTSSFILTNSVKNNHNNPVCFGNTLDLQFAGSNITDIKFMVDNGSWTSVNLGDTVKIGKGTKYDSDNVMRLDVRYRDSKNNEQTEVYFYEKVAAGTVTINNFIENGIVEYRGNVDISVSFDNVTDVKYSLAGGEYISVNNNDVINVGSTAQEDSEVIIAFKFTSSGKEITVSSTLHKSVSVSAGEEANYLSKSTASSIDNTHIAHHDGISDNASKGDVIRYIMDVSMLELQFPVRILDIEPAAVTSTLDNLEKCKELADMLELYEIKDKLNSNTGSQYYYKKYFDVTSMSVREFNSRYMDLTADYDLIYIGIDSGYVKLDSDNHRTDYRDDKMDGLVYTGIGDLYPVWAFLRGTAAEDFEIINNITDSKQLREHNYWTEDCFDGFTDNPQHSDNNPWNLDSSKLYKLKKSWTTTRLSSTDLTVKSMKALLDYVKAGYPILLADEIINCDEYIDCNGKDEDAAKWKYVDSNSKMYAFVEELKNLGKDSTGKYTGINQDGSNVFLDGKTYPSVVSWSNAKTGKNPENLPDSRKLEGGLQFALKRISRIDLKLVAKPTEYSDNVDSNLVGSVIKKKSNGVSNPEYTDYNFKLEVKGNVKQEWLESNYSYQLYIDKSSVGNFKEDQIIALDPGVEYEVNSDGSVESIKVYGKWPEGLEGFIPWKLEAYSNANRQVKFSYTGYSAFEKLSSDKRDVYVLWLRTEYPYNNKPYNVNFTDFVKENADYIEDYKIHILSMKYSEFVDMYSTQWSGGTDYTAANTLLKVNTVANYLNNKFNSYTGNSLNITSSVLNLDQEFNMIVLGYCDSYVGLDLNNRNLLNDMKRYVDAGNSLLFAHDNASYLSTMNYYINDNGSHIRAGESDYDFARYNTSYLREILGMDVYGITKSTSRLSESQANARTYLSDDIKQSDLRGFTELIIFHYEGEVSEQNGGGGKLGNQIYATKKHGTTAENINNWVNTTSVRKINKGQITEYPFVTGNNLSGTVTTKTTHSQYMQLDVENEDVLVWYTLNANGGYYMYTSGDGSNNYYIYSNGNVTYTGAGHDSQGLTTEEKKLFINTIIAALKLGNLEPVVLFPYAYESNDRNHMNYYPGDPESKGLTLTFRATDYDEVSGLTNTFSRCKIFIDKNDNGKWDEGEIILNDTSTQQGYANSSQYISNINTLEPMIINADEIRNRQNITFLITNEDIKNIGMELTGSNDSSKDYKEYVDELCKYPIVVEVTDNGSKTKPNSEATVHNSIIIDKKDYVAPDLFTLN